MANKKIQRKRMMSYFIDSANEIIEKDGVDGITLRKVANNAGYNTATLYNYFESLDHLIFYAAMRHVKYYVTGLSLYLEEANNSMDSFLMVWDCFCNYAYSKPEIYSIIFFPNLVNNMEYYIWEYYQFFPEDSIIEDDKSLDRLLTKDTNNRAKATVLGCIKEGYIRKEDSSKLIEICQLVFEGMLSRVVKYNISCEEARNKTMDYIKSIVEAFLIKDYEFYY